MKFEDFADKPEHFTVLQWADHLQRQADQRKAKAQSIIKQQQREDGRTQAQRERDSIQAELAQEKDPFLKKGLQLMLATTQKKVEQEERLNSPAHQLKEKTLSAIKDRWPDELIQHFLPFCDALMETGDETAFTLAYAEHELDFKRRLDEEFRKAKETALRADVAASKAALDVVMNERPSDDAA